MTAPCHTEVHHSQVEGHSLEQGGSHKVVVHHTQAVDSQVEELRIQAVAPRMHSELHSEDLLEGELHVPQVEDSQEVHPAHNLEEGSQVVAADTTDPEVDTTPMEEDSLLEAGSRKELHSLPAEVPLEVEHHGSQAAGHRTGEVPHTGPEVAGHMENCAGRGLDRTPVGHTQHHMMGGTCALVPNFTLPKRSPQRHPKPTLALMTARSKHDLGAVPAVERKLAVARP